MKLAGWNPGRISYTWFSESIIRVLRTPHFFIQLFGKNGVQHTQVNTVL